MLVFTEAWLILSGRRAQWDNKWNNTWQRGLKCLTVQNLDVFIYKIYIYINMEMKVLNVLHESLLSHLLATWVII